MKNILATLSLAALLVVPSMKAENKVLIREEIEETIQSLTTELEQVKKDCHTVAHDLKGEPEHLKADEKYRSMFLKCNRAQGCPREEIEQVRDKFSVAFNEFLNLQTVALIHFNERSTQLQEEIASLQAQLTELEKEKTQ